MRHSIVPQNFWQRFKARWSAEKGRIATIAAIADEAEEVETSFLEIAATAPARYSLVTTTNAPMRWDAVNEIAGRSTELPQTLEDWRTAPQTAPVASPTPTTGTRLLSLDGGGIKGVSGAIILNGILTKVREIETGTTGELESPEHASKTHKPGKHGNELIPARYFDLAGGTSTGGLMAVMLFRLGMCGPCTIQAYKDMANDIFPVTFLGINLRKWFKGALGNFILYCKILLGQPQFKGANLLRATDSLVRNMGGEVQGKSALLLENQMNVEAGHGKM